MRFSLNPLLPHSSSPCSSLSRGASPPLPTHPFPLCEPLPAHPFRLCMVNRDRGSPIPPLVSRARGSPVPPSLRENSIANSILAGTAPSESLSEIFIDVIESHHPTRLVKAFKALTRLLSEAQTACSSVDEEDEHEVCVLARGSRPPRAMSISSARGPPVPPLRVASKICTDVIALMWSAQRRTGLGEVPSWRSAPVPLRTRSLRTDRARGSEIANRPETRVESP